jgi:hypothetical protein
MAPLVPIEFDRRASNRPSGSLARWWTISKKAASARRLLDRLNETMPGTRSIRFGTHVCRNCDARFSCASYRQYAWTGRRWPNAR